jgi:signal transduction histidine kinase
MTFRQKATLYFSLGFTLLWILCSIILFLQFKKTLWNSFEEQMRARASIVAERTSIDPRIVPLPQKDESYVIIFTDSYLSDTLFVPPPIISRQMKSPKTIQTEYIKDEGVLIVQYSIPSTEVENAIRYIFTVILLVFLIGIGLSALLAYWLSGKIIKPVEQVINRANEVDIFHDIHLLPESENKDELCQMIVSFNRMLLRIKEQTEQQNTFFASASHELRTPLSIMQTRLQVLLQDKSINEDVKNSYNEQLQEVRRMIKMVNDFLLMSELQNGNVQIVKTECDLPEIIMDTLSSYKSRLEERKLQFRIMLNPEQEYFTVPADKDKLQIIINNLIGNALKYSQENSLIEIDLDKGEDIILKVSNKIRNDIHPNNINPEKRFHYAKPLNGEGSGLGLWISNQLAVMQEFDFSVNVLDKIVFESTLKLKY